MNYLGQIMIWTGSNCPHGWVPCDGQLLHKSQYEALFAVIGYEYGGSYGQFAVPDLRNRILLGASNQYPLGERGGRKDFFINPDNLPEHSHKYSIKQLVFPLSLKASLNSLGTTLADSNTPSGRLLAKESGSDNDYRDTGTKVQMAQDAISLSCQVEEANVAIPDQTNYCGNHNSVPFTHPSLCLNFIIAVTGIFPYNN